MDAVLEAVQEIQVSSQRSLPRISPFSIVASSREVATRESPTVDHSPTDQSPTSPSFSAEQLFQLLLQQLLSKKPTEEVPRIVPKTPDADLLKEDRKLWGQWGQGQYVKSPIPIAYAAGQQTTPLDYGKLFSYLGKLRTAEHMFEEQYKTDAKEADRRFHNDADSLAERVVNREIRKAKLNVWGAGLIDYTDPEETELYKKRMMLMGETMKMVRQMLVAY